MIGEKYGIDTTCESFPADDCKSDPRAYLTALKAFTAGDIVVIFTPDDTHFDIAMAAIKVGPAPRALELRPASVIDGR